MSELCISLPILFIVSDKLMFKGGRGAVCLFGSPITGGGLKRTGLIEILFMKDVNPVLFIGSKHTISRGVSDSLILFLL